MLHHSYVPIRPRVAEKAGIGIEDASGNPDTPIRDFEHAMARVTTAVDAAKRRVETPAG